jgi:hypothetical protein
MLEVNHQHVIASVAIANYADSLCIACGCYARNDMVLTGINTETRNAQQNPDIYLPFCS